jgi:LacI family transcriptional regulator
MITTSEIAARLGYSQQTVSDVLRRGRKYDRYSEETRRRIEEAAAELGYRPNAAAQAMNSGRFNAVGVLMSRHFHQSAVHGEMLRGIHDALDQRGLHLTITFVDDTQLTSDEKLPQVLRRAMVDGLLLNYTHGIPQVMAELIERHRLPAVWVNSKQKQNCVYIDDEGGAAEATRRLLARGHQRIAYCDLTAGLETADEIHYSRVDRFRGYQHAMRRARLACQSISPPKPLLHEAAVRFVCEHLSQPDAPTAVLCYGQQELVALVSALQALRPGAATDLALAVFNERELPFAPPHDVALLPEFDVGHAAATVLLALLADRDHAHAPVAVPMRFASTSQMSH